MILMKILHRSTLFLLFAICLQSAPAFAAGSILVWPIDPVIEGDEKAIALWLENRGTQTSLLQLRIFSWTQSDGEDSYADQEDIVGTPPMIRIEPGKRQMVRLTRITAARPGTEQAYRVLIDEIPTQEAAPTPAEGQGAAVGIRFQFRYSIPLFVYGEGLSEKLRADIRRNAETSDQTALAWRITIEGEQSYLEITNTGQLHARLTGTYFQQGAKSTNLASGLFGYVLPGATIRRPLPNPLDADATLMATVNSSSRPLAIAAME